MIQFARAQKSLTAATVLCAIPLLTGMRFETPCCTVISVDAAKGTTLIRNIKTARTYQATLPASIASRLKVGDEAEADLSAGTLSAVGSTSVSQSIHEPDPVAPCCNATGIRGLNAAAAGFLAHAADVTVQRKETGRSFRITVNSTVLTGIKEGHPIELTPKGDWAIVRLADNGKKLAYSFPVGEVRSAEQKRWAMTPAADLKGRLGRLVVKLPKEVEYEYSFVAIYAPGEAKESEKAPAHPLELIAGEYDVDVAGARVERVPIQKAMETRLFAGALRINAGDSTRVTIFDEDRRKVLWVYGKKVIGLPAGHYFVTTGGAFEKVEVKDGEVTDF